MKNLSINEAVEILNKDLKSRKSVKVEMKINKEWTTFKVKNYFATYQTERADLILVEVRDLAFTVSVSNSDFTVARQIRRNF